MAMNPEILQIADAVAREKGISREAVIAAIERGYQVAGRRKYGHEHRIRAELNRKTGEVELFRELEIIPDNAEEQDVATQITLTEAKKRHPGVENMEVGAVVSEPLLLLTSDLGRVTSQSAKQAIVQKVRDAEREVQYEDFKDRKGEIVHGVVKRVEFGDVFVTIGSAEGLMRRNGTIRGEAFRVNDRVRAFVLDVRREAKGPQIFLSRSCPEFLIQLFAQEVPEIYDGVIEVKSAARDPGSRAKIAVFSKDSSLDPVGSCVGVRGSRVQAVINELQGEKIDIIQWSADPATFVVAALAPADVSKVVIDENNHRLEVVVPDDQLSLAIGRRGQNVRLASQLVGWGIDVMTEAQESERRSQEFVTLSKLFTEALNVEEVIAQLLVTEGFTSLEEVAYVDQEDLETIEGFDENIAAELQSRARSYLERQEKAIQDEWHALGVSEELKELPGMTPAILVALGKKNVKSLDDLADLARDEFKELVPDSGLSNNQIDQMIMEARSHWFNDEEKENRA